MGLFEERIKEIESLKLKSYDRVVLQILAIAENYNLNYETYKNKIKK
jgi:hypothetical protein